MGRLMIENWQFEKEKKTAGLDPPRFSQEENFVHFEVLVNGRPSISKRLGFRLPTINGSGLVLFNQPESF